MAGGAAAELASAAGTGGGGKDTLVAMMEVLAKLVLQNSQELREITGVEFLTFMKKADGANPIEVALLEAGASYDQKAKEWKDERDRAKEEKGQEPLLLGPPHLHAWARLIKELTEDKYKPLLPGDSREVFAHYWNHRVSKVPNVEELDVDVKVMRMKKLKAGNRKGDLKLQICNRDPNLESHLVKVLKHTGWERKVGPAPRAALEREAQRLLDKMRR